MAQCAYTNNCLIAGFNSLKIETLADAPETFTAVALLNSMGNQVVLSIAGTDDATDWFKVNPTFLNPDGEPTQLFRDYVKASTDALIELSTLYPDAEITLTGHSLGGALAQLLAQATGFPATTFNAPGAAQTVPSLSLELEGLKSLANPIGKVGVTNYRIYGDLVSTIGDQIGSTITFEPPIPQWQVDSFAAGTAKAMHEMLFINERISSGASITSETGPVFTRVLGDSLIDVASGVVLNPLSLVAPVTSIVVAGQQLWIDPEDYDLYQFFVDTGSPHVQTITFPLVTQFDALFNLQTFTNDEWLSLGLFGELFQYDFGLGGVDLFRFFILDEFTNKPPGYIEPLTFGMTFVSDGTLNGTFSAASTREVTSVPEPSSLVLLLAGITSLVWTRRRHECQYLRNL
jgi:hypothetical protein